MVVFLSLCAFSTVAPFLILFFIGAYALWTFRNPAKALIALWIAIPYLIFTLIGTKTDRYYLPCLPAFALLAALGIEYLSLLKLRTLLIGIITSIFLVSHIPFFPENNISLNSEPFCSNYQETCTVLGKTIQEEMAYAKKLSCTIEILTHKGGFDCSGIAGILRYMLHLQLPTSRISLQENEWYHFPSHKDRDFLIIGLHPIEEKKADLLREFRTPSYGLSDPQLLLDELDIETDENSYLMSGHISYAIPRVLLEKSPSLHAPGQKFFFVTNEQELLALIKRTHTWILLKKQLFLPDMTCVYLFKKNPMPRQDGK